MRQQDAPDCAGNMRLAIIGINYAPEEIGIARYTTDMAVWLAERGHNVEVIAGKPYYPQWSVYPAYRGGGWRRGVEKGVRVTRCPLYVPAKPGGLKRVIHLASFGLSAVVPVLGLRLRPREDRPQVVLCVVPALLSVPVAWIAARLCGARLWIHVQEFEVEAALATGLVVSRGLRSGIGRWVENLLLGLADRVSTISPQMCVKLAEKGVPQDRIREVRNWADQQFGALPVSDAAYRAQWGVGTRQVALYSGNISNKQGIDVLVRAARLLQAREDILFIICGQGPNRLVLKGLAEGLANIQFHDLQPAERMGEMLSLASVHLLPQIKGAADLVLPSKLTNILASGRPVVATAEPGTGLYDEVEGCGLAVPPDDPQALADALVRLVDNADLRARLGESARLRASERWHAASILGRLEADLAALAREGADVSGEAGADM